jgi:acyl-CoA thioesterase-1
MMCRRCHGARLAIFALWALVCALGCVTACRPRGDASDGLSKERRASAAASPGADGPLPAVAGATGPRVVILGDSLTAGLGLPMARAYPSLLQRHIADAGLMYTIVNAGVSGDTSAGGLSRLDWALDGDVRILVVALGGNDALRGLPVAELTRNLSQIIERAQSRGITVVLAGMEAPPNYGVDYTLAFHKVYPALAKKYRVALVPFLLERVAGITQLNQADGIHPTAEGAQIVADTVWSTLKPLIEEDARREGPGKAPSQ